MAGVIVHPPSVEDELKDALEYRAATRREADQADDAFRAAVRSAFAGGMTASQIREITGLTNSRLYQIKSGRRT